MIPQFKATDRPYSEAEVLYIVKGTLTLLIEGNSTGNNDASDDVIPPTINKLDNTKL